ncbi:MAG: hypothetical protein KTU85_00870, partial [Acidimicrobiia bacterium]|nr:hypothetical protein [Acidimicrobiia bacterium]
NGPTNLENLVLVCNDCHHKIHDDGWQVHKHPDTGKYQLKPPTRPTSKRPATLSGEPSTHPADKRPTLSLGEPLSGPANKRPTVLSDKPARTSSGEPSTRRPGEYPTGSSDESSTRPTDAYPTGSSDESSTRPPGERSAVSSDEVSTISTNRPDRARTREDPAQPEASGATQSTIENERGFAHFTHAQQEKQTRSDTVQPCPAARTTGHDPVGSIDTS